MPCAYAASDCSCGRRSGTRTLQPRAFISVSPSPSYCLCPPQGTTVRRRHPTRLVQTAYTTTWSTRHVNARNYRLQLYTAATRGFDTPNSRPTYQGTVDQPPASNNRPSHLLSSHVTYKGLFICKGQHRRRNAGLATLVSGALCQSSHVMAMFGCPRSRKRWSGESTLGIRCPSFLCRGK